MPPQCAERVNPATFRPRDLGLPYLESSVRLVTTKADPQTRPSSPDPDALGCVPHGSTDVPTLAEQLVGTSVVLGVPRLDPARVRRLAELGLRPGTEVLVLHRTAGRGRVLAIGETRLALDRATLEALPVGRSTDRAATLGVDGRDLP